MYTDRIAASEEIRSASYETRSDDASWAESFDEISNAPFLSRGERALDTKVYIMNAFARTASSIDQRHSQCWLDRLLRYAGVKF